MSESPTNIYMLFGARLKALSFSLYHIPLVGSEVDDLHITVTRIFINIADDQQLGVHQVDILGRDATRNKLF